MWFSLGPAPNLRTQPCSNGIPTAPRYPNSSPESGTCPFEKYKVHQNMPTRYIQQPGHCSSCAVCPEIHGSGGCFSINDWVLEVCAVASVSLQRCTRLDQSQKELGDVGVRVWRERTHARGCVCVCRGRIMSYVCSWFCTNSKKNANTTRECGPR